MKQVYDSGGTGIGSFDGRFVFDSTGAKRYWIDGTEVFSMPPLNGDCQSTVRAAVKVADFVDGVAVDFHGNALFRL